MIPKDPRSRIALAASAVLVVLGIVAAMVQASDDGRVSHVTGSGSPGPTAVGETPAAGDDAATPAPGSAEPASDGAAPSNGGSGGAADESGPSALRPPQPGTYRYREVKDGESNEERIVIEAAGSEGDTVRQRERFEGGSGSEFPDGTNEVVWRPDGKVVERTFIGSGEDAYECDWEPDIVEYPLPLEVGAAWEVQSSCTIDQGAFTIEMALEGAYRVTGTERIEVAGTTLETWVVEGETTFTTSSAAGEAVFEVSSREHLSGSHGVSVRSREESRGTFGGDTTETTSTREILNLTPE